MSNLTYAQHRVVVDLSSGEWSDLMGHSKAVIARVYGMGLIRCDVDDLPYNFRIWTITPEGEAAIGGDA